MYIWRHDICHVIASRWCHICQNVSPIPSNRYYEAIFAVGIIKKVTGEKRQGGGTPPGRPRVKWIKYRKKAINPNVIFVDSYRFRNPEVVCKNYKFRGADPSWPDKIRQNHDPTWPDLTRPNQRVDLAGGQLICNLATSSASGVVFRIP